MGIPKHYCFREPPFPQKAWGIAIYLERGGELRGINVMPYFFQALDEIPGKIEKLLDYLVKDSQMIDLTVAPQCLLLPLSLSSLVPLRREYWERPVFDFDTKLRYQAFLPFLSNPLMYQVLALPCAYLRQRWRFELAAPFRLGSDMATLEKFLEASNYPVWEEASQAALFEVGRFRTLDWRTLKTFELDSSQWPDEMPP